MTRKVKQETKKKVVSVNVNKKSPSSSSTFPTPTAIINSSTLPLSSKRRRPPKTTTVKKKTKVSLSKLNKNSTILHKQQGRRRRGEGKERGDHEAEDADNKSPGSSHNFIVDLFTDTTPPTTTGNVLISQGKKRRNKQNNKTSLPIVSLTRSHSNKKHNNNNNNNSETITRNPTPGNHHQRHKKDGYKKKKMKIHYTPNQLFLPNISYNTKFSKEQIPWLQPTSHHNHHHHQVQQQRKHEQHHPSVYPSNMTTATMTTTAAATTTTTNNTSHLPKDKNTQENNSSTAGDTAVVSLLPDVWYTLTPSFIHRLNQEILDFSCYVTLSQQEIYTREWFINQIHHVAQKVFMSTTTTNTDVTTEIFGSYACPEVCTFFSDVDIKLDGIIDHEEEDEVVTMRMLQQEQQYLLLQQEEEEEEKPTNHLKQVSIDKNQRLEYNQEDSFSTKKHLSKKKRDENKVAKWRQALMELEAPTTISTDEGIINVEKKENSNKTQLKKKRPISTNEDSSMIMVDQQQDEEEDTKQSMIKKSLEENIPNDDDDAKLLFVIDRHGGIKEDDYDTTIKVLPVISSKESKSNIEEMLSTSSPNVIMMDHDHPISSMICHNTTPPYEDEKNRVLNCIQDRPELIQLLERKEKIPFKWESSNNMANERIVVMMGSSFDYVHCDPIITKENASPMEAKLNNIQDSDTLFVIDRNENSGALLDPPSFVESYLLDSMAQVDRCDEKYEYNQEDCHRNSIDETDSADPMLGFKSSEGIDEDNAEKFYNFRKVGIKVKDTKSSSSSKTENNQDSEILEVSVIQKKPSTSTYRRNNQKTRHMVVNALKQLGKRLRREGQYVQADTVHVRKHARVPIVSFKTRFDFESDIVINHGEVVDTSAYASSQVCRFRSFAPVTLILKSLLQQTGDMDKPFTSGIGSYKLYVLLSFHIQEHLKYGGHDSPAEILLTFLLRFGHKASEFSNIQRVAFTTLSNDTTLESDGGRADCVFNIDKCKALFAESFSRLMIRLTILLTKPSHSWLSCIIDSLRLRVLRTNSMNKQLNIKDNSIKLDETTITTQAKAHINNNVGHPNKAQSTKRIHVHNDHSRDPKKSRHETFI